jgi:hypothetical protein
MLLSPPEPSWQYAPPAVPRVRSPKTCPFGELRAVEATVLGPGIYACTVFEPLTSIGWS